MNGIIYESTDSWWTRHGGEVGCAIAFLAIFAAIAWGADVSVSWKAANETIREGGKLHVLSALPQLLRYKKLDDKPAYDPGQFAFLQGNEECAREWQDPQNY